MNPFDLRGPEFLLFYVGFALVTFAVLWALDRLQDPSEGSERLLRDPYLIAGLRGGEREIIRLAVLALLARGAIVEAGKHKVALAQIGGRLPERDRGAPAPPSKDPVEAAVLRELATGPEEVRLLERDRLIQAAARAPMESLRGSGLLPSEERLATRERAATVAGVLLAGVAAWKLVLAVQRGRSNVWFLILLAGLAVWACWAWAHARPRARAGRRVLSELRTLFGGRRARCPRDPVGGDARELLLAAAVGGIVGGPFPPAMTPRRGGRDSTSGCGAGASCGFGAGSSCGGGCGGGCGGCGS